MKANSVHISLNFDGADQLDKQKLTAIADTYMQQCPGSAVWHHLY
ncbi:hypothetical protein [Niastella caeni]